MSDSGDPESETDGGDFENLDTFSDGGSQASTVARKSDLSSLPVHLYKVRKCKFCGRTADLQNPMLSEEQIKLHNSKLDKNGSVCLPVPKKKCAKGEDYDCEALVPWRNYDFNIKVGFRCPRGQYCSLCYNTFRASGALLAFSISNYY